MEEDLDKRLLSSKAVIIEEPETLLPGVSPSLEGRQAAELPVSPKKRRATLGSRRLSGRHSLKPYSASLHSTTSHEDNLDGPSSGTAPAPEQSHPHHHRHTNHVLSQVRDWLHHEKARTSKHKSRLHLGHAKKEGAVDVVKNLAGQARDELPKPHIGHCRRHSSESTDGAVALEELERILNSNLQLADNVEAAPSNRKASLTSKRGSMRRALRKKSTGISSDTDYPDVDKRVPSTDVILDNSKTLSYTGGAGLSQSSLNGPGARKEAEAWVHFKNEIVRLAHTLKLTGWRRVPLERGTEIDIERLSGALTNAVYVVSPPKNLPHTSPSTDGDATPLPPKKPPVKLLLRIYGPQAEHLIDREKELQILRRLARQNIGPKMLGTFTNGRFEEFFNAQTLTAKDIRMPETSKQIAKRMRELHEGIELLEEERKAGPFMWQNWDKWKGRCQEVISWIDEKMMARQEGHAGTGVDAWEKHGLVCGVEWQVFRSAVEKYRKWLEDQSGGPQGVKENLVFAHNDTQYGNILRERPSGESPLLLPQNEHKQLIVIDFEYASANVPGLEFANHFTEWCYNYHNASKPYALNQHHYPTPEEQHRFVKAYVQHQTRRPPLSTQSSTTSLRPALSHSISNFMLDSRAPPAQIAEEEKQREAFVESEVQRLLHQARMWRPANSAFWTAWGIIQAKVPGMDDDA
ncbi:MAG: hypothetical protein Q9212_003596, partial [Teloschistes hypoglaucus]